MNIKNIFAIISMFFVVAITGTASAAEQPAGEMVQFLLDGKLYDGYLDVDANERLRADLVGDTRGERDDDMSEIMRGYRVLEHQDVGLDVYLLGDREGIAFRYGIIEEVYDNGYHKIGVYSESYHNGETIHLIMPNYLVINKAVLLHNGGFAILK